MFSKRLNKPGYAIAEVLLAMVIISISFLQLSQSLGNIMDAAKENIFVTRAVNLANSKIEEVMAQPFDAKGSEANDYALIFDGTGDYIDLGNVFDGVQTVSFWLEVDNIDGARTDYIIDFDGSQYIRVNNGTLESNIDPHTFYVNGVQGVTTVGAINQWYHVAFTTTSIDADDVQIGKLGGNAAEFAGKIDEVRFWDGVRTAAEIAANFRNSISNPYNDSQLKLYLRMNNSSGSKAFDSSSNMKHGAIEGSKGWTSASGSWSTTLGTEGESSWSEYNDVDDFNGKTFTHNYYTGMTGTVTVAYVDINTSNWAITNPSSSPPTDYKQITVRVNIPGGDDYAQLQAIKSAKTIQNYGLTYSPFGN